MNKSVSFKNTININNRTYEYFDVKKLGIKQVEELPYSIRVLLECALRNYDDYNFKKVHIDNILNWFDTYKTNVEIPFKPSRVLLQDFTGVPAIVDFAAMRDSISELGGNPKLINPVCPSDLVIDHSVQVDFSKSGDALEKNQNMEFDRNHERFSFLKWGANNLNNMLIVPPGSGIVHQVNLESLARLVFGVDGGKNILYPDSVVGTDSHTTMINGLGVLGWGVGGIEAEAVMLDQPVNLVLPPVTGFRLIGKMKPTVTSTDLVLTVTNKLRSLGVVGHFVEFFGPGVTHLSIADRATVANMCPEYGATCGYFPPDEISLKYLTQTGRNPVHINVIREYLIANKLFSPDWTKQEAIVPKYSRILELDLASIEPCLAGPKRPHDYVSVSNLKQEFEKGLCAPLTFKSFNIDKEEANKVVKISMPIEGSSPVDVTLTHGDVVIAAITSCTNTSNPSVMLGAGLLAKKACEKGLIIKPHIKTSLSPGSGVVTKYLEKSGLTTFLNKLGFNIVGYGCMTCIGNSGPLQHESISKAIEDNNLVAASVLSGNRNFEGRVHPLTRANYLASPPLVIAYALAGTVKIEFDKQPIGFDASTKQPVFLRDIWPTNEEISLLESECILPEMFHEVYNSIKEGGSDRWKQLSVTRSDRYSWQPKSTYIRKPSFFDGLTKELPVFKPINHARVLLNLGNSITTDHISPAGAIARNSPAARYLGENGVKARDFNSYGSRRGNDEVMCRGTFANIRLINKFLEGRAGPRTKHWPSGDEMDIYDCAQRYKADKVSVIILAGKEYGSGSSRDWAAKGPYLLGVRAVIAESFERIHRSNLIGMGIMPLQFVSTGTSADSLGLTGREQFTLDVGSDMKPGQMITVSTDDNKTFQVKSRFDTEVELEYFRHGGILQYMIRKLLN